MDPPEWKVDKTREIETFHRAFIFANPIMGIVHFFREQNGTAAHLHGHLNQSRQLAYLAGDRATCASNRGDNRHVAK